MDKQYDLTIYIGRFQPFHEAHRQTILAASNISKHTLVLIGSSRSPRTPKNPWTVQEREEMIRDTVGADVPNLHVGHVRDFVYDDSQWVARVGELVSSVVMQNEDIDGKNIAVIGHDKDHSSFYLNFFPHWDFVNFDSYPPRGETIDATKIRDLMFKGDYAFVKSVVPETIYKEIMWFIDSKEFSVLKEDWDYVEAYKKSWASSPYPPTFSTCDAIVVQSGHVLLIQRGENPGKGMWAIPGGFIDVNEKIDNAVIRELREETKLKVPEKVLRGSIVHKEVFDDPDRGRRGRTITHASLFKLDDAAKLPVVKGSDDAAVARWFPFSDFKEMEPVMYEDHWHIVNHLLNKI